MYFVLKMYSSTCINRLLHSIKINRVHATDFIHGNFMNLHFCNDIEPSVSTY